MKGSIARALATKTKTGVFTGKHLWCLASDICKSPLAGRRSPGGGRRRDRGSSGRRQCRLRPLTHCWGTTTVSSLTWETLGLALCHRRWPSLSALTVLPKRCRWTREVAPTHLYHSEYSLLQKCRKWQLWTGSLNCCSWFKGI